MLRPLTPAVKNILIITGLFYLATQVLMPNGAGNSFYLHEHFMFKFFGLWPLGSEFFYPWQFLSSIFMHSAMDFRHILFNMFAVYMFGSALERVWGAKKFIFFYLSCGIGAAVLSAIGHLVMGDAACSVGASGSVFGLLAAYALIYPNNVIMLLFPPIPLKAKYFVLIYAAFELYMLYSNKPGDNVGHLAHLAGALVGFLIVKYWERQRNKFDYYQ